ncbi:MAG: ATP-binding protein [Deltaproteobacteria bacterium]|jgi:hypothetical protein|nr:ATP-binding protein [Deltaproteobacteria bacterium]
MTQDLPTLPIGTQDFEGLRLEKEVYVDKTMYLPMLRKAGRIVFCSRPRRFGKTLTVTTLDAFYSGRKDLFLGLAAEKYMDSPGFATRPVIHLDMNRVAGSGDIGLLTKRIQIMLESNAARHDVKLEGVDCYSNFFSLMQNVSQPPTKKAVLLIDEYDAPVISLVQRGELLRDDRLVQETRETMRNLYSQIKSAEKSLELAFITAVTKFSRMGVFSTLNNLVDISLRPEFAAFMGLTQEELERYFSHHVRKTARERGVGESELLGQIREYYHGFSFDGKTRLYNPFSTLSFFGEGEFDDFWMESGSNAIVRNFLKDKTLTVDQFQDIEVNRQFARSPGEIGATPPHGFLYQAGYLTLRAKGGALYGLDYPNLEVRSAISTLFLENLIPAWDDVGKDGRELGRCLAAGDVPGMVGVLRRLLAGIAHDDHADADRPPRGGSLDRGIRAAAGPGLADETLRRLSAELARRIRRAKGESFYVSILYAGLWMAGAQVASERHGNLGRLDLEVRHGGLLYVIEAKMAADARGGAKAARAGMGQIRGRGYGQAEKDPILVALAIGRKERNVVACLFEKDGRLMAVDGQGRPSLANMDIREKTPKPKS